MRGKSTKNTADGPLQRNMEFLIKLDSTLGKELLDSMNKGEEWLGPEGRDSILFN